MDTVVNVVGATPGDIDLLLQTEQIRDPEIVKLRDKLEREAVGCFELIDGIIYRKNDAGRLCLYAPTQIQEQLIRLCHEKLGHLTSIGSQSSILTSENLKKVKQL